LFAKDEKTKLRKGVNYYRLKPALRKSCKTEEKKNIGKKRSRRNKKREQRKQRAEREKTHIPPFASLRELLQKKKSRKVAKNMLWFFIFAGNFLLVRNKNELRFFNKLFFVLYL
jgi:hypothetical protein